MTFTRLRCLLARIARHAVIGAVFVVSVATFYWLVLSEPNYAIKRSIPCPDILRGEQSRASLPANQTAASRKVDCAAIFRGDQNEVAFASQYKWCKRYDVTSGTDYEHLARDCEAFKQSRGYLKYELAEEEIDFPIAFSILMHEQAEQVERLIRSIYRSHNVYCIHVDSKASSKLHKVMKSIAKCFDNVFTIENPVSVHWAEFTVLEAELRCIEQLWKHQVKWKYFINLTGREFPIRTNWELVSILRAYDGANDIDGTPHKLVKTGFRKSEREIVVRPNDYVIKATQFEV